MTKKLLLMVCVEKNPHDKEIPKADWWKAVEEKLDWRILWQLTPICFKQFTKKETDTRPVGLHLHFSNNPEFGTNYNEEFSLVEKQGWFVSDAKEQIKIFKDGLKKFKKRFGYQPRFFTSGWFRCTKELVEFAKTKGIIVVDRVGNEFDVARYGMYSEDVYDKIKKGQDLVVGYTHSYEYKQPWTKRMFEERLATLLKFAKEHGYVDYFSEEGWRCKSAKRQTRRVLAK